MKKNKNIAEERNKVDGKNDENENINNNERATSKNNLTLHRLGWHPVHAVRIDSHTYSSCPGG